MSICPKARIRVATDRPDSWRKIRPIVSSSTPVGASPARSTPFPSPTDRSVMLLGLLGVPEGADLDRHADDRARLGRPAQGCIQIVSLYDVEAGHVLLRLHQRP